MGFFARKKKEAAVRRIFEEKIYEIVAAEIEEAGRRPGLWAKALANSDGDENKAKSLYINYRAQSMLDEAELESEAALERMAALEKEAAERLARKTEIEVEAKKEARRSREIRNDKDRLEVAKEILKEKGYKVRDYYNFWVVIEPLGGRHKASTSEELLQYAYSRQSSK